MKQPVWVKFSLAVIALLSVLSVATAQVYAEDYVEHSYSGIKIYVPSGVDVSWRTGEWTVASFTLTSPTIVKTNIKPSQVYVDGVPVGFTVNGSTYCINVWRPGKVEVYYGRKPTGEPPTGLIQYLSSGDLVGFALAAWQALMSQIFWVIPYMVLFIPLYIKTGSAEYCAIVFILLSGALLTFMPAETGAIAGLFLALSFGFLLYKLVVKVMKIS